MGQKQLWIYSVMVVRYFGCQYILNVASASGKYKRNVQVILQICLFVIVCLLLPAPVTAANCCWNKYDARCGGGGGGPELESVGVVCEGP